LNHVAANRNLKHLRSFAERSRIVASKFNVDPIKHSSFTTQTRDSCVPSRMSDPTPVIVATVLGASEPAVGAQPFSNMTAWGLLLLAGLLEIVWAIGLKYSQGFTKLVPTTISIIGLVASFVILAQAVRVLPISVAYAAWTGIGATGVAIIGMIIYKEPASAARIACLMLIIAGMLGLKYLTIPAAKPDANTPVPLLDTQTQSRN